jgi:hypothetical protein
MRLKGGISLLGKGNIFSPPLRLGQFWGAPSLLPMVGGVLFPSLPTTADAKTMWITTTLIYEGVVN